MTEEEAKEASELADAIVNFIAAEPVSPPAITIPALCMVLTSIVEEQEGDLGENKAAVLRTLEHFYEDR